MCSKSLAAWTAGILLIVVALFDILRLSNKKVNAWVFKKVPFLFKTGEFSAFSASPAFLGGVLLSLLIFPADYASGGIIYLSIGDMTAALVGQKWGRKRIFNKTLLGSLAFVLSTFVFLTVLSQAGVLNLNILGIAVGSVVCALVELLPLKIDDNFIIPLAGSLVLFIIN
ncbi:MAG: diacylglycerol/polyprenol kinase family protein [Elusimicrobiota bacterium]